MTRAKVQVYHLKATFFRKKGYGVFFTVVTAYDVGVLVKQVLK